MHTVEGPKTSGGYDFETFLSIAMYSSCSISMILLNKLVIGTYGIDYPMGLLFLQNIAAVLLVVAAKRFGFCHYPSFDMRIAKKWLPLTLFFVAMLWTSMKSLQLMSVAVQTILKNCAIILTAMGDAYFFNKVLTRGMFVSFGLMILGSTLGSLGDPWITFWGVFWTVANILVTVSYVLYMKLLLGDVSKEIGRYGPVFYNNLLSLPFILVMSFVELGDMMNAIHSSPVGAKLCLFFMILVGSVMTFASFWCMKMTSPTTYSVCGALNKIPLTILGIFIFHHYPTSLGTLGIVVALSGGKLYTYLSLPRPKPQEDDSRRVV